MEINKEMTKNIDKDVFQILIQGLRCETGSAIESIKMLSEWGPYSIRFYGEMRDGHQLVLEDFGALLNGKWVEMEPTSFQMVVMQERLTQRANRIYNEMEQEHWRFAQWLSYQAEYGEHLDWEYG